jgi:hypothetical protein
MKDYELKKAGRVPSEDKDIVSTVMQRRQAKRVIPGSGLSTIN